MYVRNLRMSIAVAAALCGFTNSLAAAEAPAESYAWKAGVASVKITPDGSMWMAGYASRDKPSEGVAQDLYAKALALEDADGRRLVMITTDLIGIPRAVRDWLEADVRDSFKLPREGLLLNASHTHCGPELRVRRAADDAPDTDRAAKAEAYVQSLQAKLHALVDEALGKLAPAKLDYLSARAGFAMNRRLKAGDGYKNSPNRTGPVDHDVPVLRVTDADGKLSAVVFGYACHNTTLGFYMFCGDYAGYAQECLQQDLPGVTALFMMGCGGDQNPYPRRELEYARQHGRTLATAVLAALDTEPRSVSGPLRAAIEEVTLEFAPPPSREGLLNIAHTAANKYERAHAQRLLNQLEQKGTIDLTYPYLVQVVRLGDDVLLAALAGEVVVDYSLRLKRELAGDADVWIAGYSNDVFGYVPSVRVLEEGGYEGGGAMLHTSLPGPFAPSIEERIVSTVQKLARQTAGSDR